MLSVGRCSLARVQVRCTVAPAAPISLCCEYQLRSATDGAFRHDCRRQSISNWRLPGLAPINGAPGSRPQGRGAALTLAPGAPRRHAAAAAAAAAAEAAAMSSSYSLRLDAKTEEELAAAKARLLNAPLRTVVPSTKEEVSLEVCAVGDMQAPECGFDASAFFGALQTKALGRVLLSSRELPSTQTLMQDNRDVLPDGLVCVADHQSAGKGRGGNVWTSPDGCLMFSVATSTALQGTRLPFVQYVVSIAVVEAVQQLAAQALVGGKQEDKGQQQDGDDSLLAAAGPPLLRIKWPNDLYSAPSSSSQQAPGASGGAGTAATAATAAAGAASLPPLPSPGPAVGGLKVGGVLCHSAYRGGAFHVTVGVGLNLDNRDPTTCVNELVMRRHQQLLQQQQQQQQGGSGGVSGSGSGDRDGAEGYDPPPPPAAITREALLACVLTRLEAGLATLLDQGFDPMRDAYLRYWMHSGQKVVLEEAVEGEEGSGTGYKTAAGGGGATGAGGSAARNGGGLVRRVPLVVQGLSASGFLLAEDEEGRRFELHPDGNSLDFFKGLVRKKVQQ